jgi:hypothetical protein
MFCGWKRRPPARPVLAAWNWISPARGRGVHAVEQRVDLVDRRLAALLAQLEGAAGGGRGRAAAS